MNKKPYLTIVATTRNDNHGGDLLERTICFLEGAYHQAARSNMRIELIMVEWNPPKDKPLLKDVLPLPPKNCLVDLRFVIVPSSIHNQYAMAPRLSLFQMIAKNVGIKRAKGEYVLCTNIDLLFSNDLFDFLAKKELNNNCFYRAKRVDVEKEIMKQPSFEEKIKFANNPKNIIKILGKTAGNEYIFGVPAFFYAFSTVTKVLNQIFKAFIHLTNNKTNITIWTLDTPACGDFTLMSKQKWIEIEGYPELDLYSIHVDSMGLLGAVAIGMKQVILPKEMCSYHIYHEDGWESFDKNLINLIRFMEKKPGLDWYTVVEASKKLIENKKTWGLNKPDWGFANEKFKEYIFEAGKEMQEVN